MHCENKWSILRLKNMQRFAPTVRGPVQLTLSIPSNDPANPTIQVSLTGNGIDLPGSIRVNPDILSFGVVIIGQKLTQGVHVVNIGCEPLTINSLFLQSSAASANVLEIVSAKPPTIAPVSSVMILVRFSPIDESDVTGTLLISSSDPSHGRVSVALEGTGYNPGGAGGLGGSGGPGGPRGGLPPTQM